MLSQHVAVLWERIHDVWVVAKPDGRNSRILNVLSSSIVQQLGLQEYSCPTKVGHLAEVTLVPSQVPVD